MNLQVVTVPNDVSLLALDAATRAGRILSALSVRATGNALQQLPNDIEQAIASLEALRQPVADLSVAAGVAQTLEESQP